MIKSVALEPPKIAEFDEDSASKLTQFMQDVADAIDGGLMITTNLSTKVKSVTFEAGGAEQAIDHGLGRKPAGYIPISKSADTDITQADRQGDANRIYLSSTNPATVKLLFF